MKHLPPLVLLALLSACKPAEQAPTPSSAPPALDTAPAPASSYPPVQPIEPGKPGGLPDDRTPISEAPFTATSAQGAADVVQHYFAYLEAGKIAEAYALWSGGSPDRPSNLDALKQRQAAYLEYHAQVGAPGQSEGAAGSIYIDVPVQVYGRAKDGKEVHVLGKVTLRRVNDVPGSTAEQRLWRIQSAP